MNRDHRATGGAVPVIGMAVTLAALLSTAAGAAVAKSLFPVIGALGIAALRLNLAAVLLLGFRRPWSRSVPRNLRWGLLGYGLILGLMNLLIYQAFSRIPIGIAVAIEVTGPLAVALFGSRRLRDFAWLLAAVTGLLLLLLPGANAASLDPLGVAFAAASGLCWALYILTGKHVAEALGGDAVAWGMLIAAVLAMPFGAAHGGAALLMPWVLGVGLVIAFLSSALPCLLEMEAMRRLPAPVFGLLTSAAPAIGALAGYAILGERLTPTQWFAILCIMVASAASTLTAGLKQPLPESLR